MKTEDKLVKSLYETEFQVADRNQDDDEYGMYLDLLDSVRTEKDYDWNSDIRLPEFVSHWLTQSSYDVNHHSMSSITRCYL